MIIICEDHYVETTESLQKECTLFFCCFPPFVVFTIFLCPVRSTNTMKSLDSTSPSKTSWCGFSCLVSMKCWDSTSHFWLVGQRLQIQDTWLHLPHFRYLSNFKHRIKQHTRSIKHLFVKASITNITSCYKKSLANPTILYTPTHIPVNCDYKIGDTNSFQKKPSHLTPPRCWVFGEALARAMFVLPRLVLTAWQAQRRAEEARSNMEEACPGVRDQETRRGVLSLKLKGCEFQDQEWTA